MTTGASGPSAPAGKTAATAGIAVTATAAVQTKGKEGAGKCYCQSALNTAASSAAA